MGERITIRTKGVAAEIALSGAELVGLKDAAGGELLWQGGPEWTRQAPVLFPIVGRLAGDALRHEGEAHHVTQHGFARDRIFEVIERTDSRAVLRLSDDAQTRALFPFAFTLDMIYEVEDTTLSVTARVANPGAEVLPCGIGAHPGFRWPLVDGIAKDDHVIEFDAPESGEALSVVGGLLGPGKPLPFDGRTLPLSEALFANDAIVMPGVASRSVRYVAKGADGGAVRALSFSWEGYKDLGIWSKPGGALFVCIEPWYSMASPVGWDGEFSDKPGILHLGPGESRDMIWRVTL
ncbi:MULTISPECIES: aldose 1-epimerase family protein [unclassified Aureimonas]|uniref:aldose 1-epimerase family protein n=1 Tax=unclassified Aureimonas TaxID=2615206 RepID=UPI0006FF0DEE|nr:MULTISPECIES: aldose 1-epimerase family protein [unclassified Aureimonas]KQT61857.1 aldose epimerase [Aureimonas sp. Leaf427]KQT74888.1 aldose epimerase [Aureimonas sp. Leaf460]